MLSRRLFRLSEGLRLMFRPFPFGTSFGSDCTLDHIYKPRYHLFCIYHGLFTAFIIYVHIKNVNTFSEIFLKSFQSRFKCRIFSAFHGAAFVFSSGFFRLISFFGERLTLFSFFHLEKSTDFKIFFNSERQKGIIFLFPNRGKSKSAEKSNFQT